MNGARLTPISFAPDIATLDAAVERMAELGPNSGGAFGEAARRRAFAAYIAARDDRAAHPRGWRHDYARLPFDNVRWTTGRIRVPASGRTKPTTGAATAVDAPALAADNAGGLVHAGGTFLEPAERSGDLRVRLIPLADAVRDDPALGETLGTIVSPHADRFAALAAAFQNCGAYVEVPAGVAIEAPLQLVWTARPGVTSAVFPHTVVRLGAGARATIVERHVGDAETFTDGIVEIDLAPGARLDYVVVQSVDDASRIIMRRSARCAADACIAWHLAELGGALARSVVRARLRGTRAHAETNALFFARGYANVELSAGVEHHAARTTSDGIVRSAATDRGIGRFAGDLRIANTARRCDASLRDDGLVLAPTAYLDAIPALRVAANDVAALHAASVGSLDDEALFYVQSRGIARAAAARMIALAFFEAAIVRFPSDALRDEIRTALDARLDDVGETFAS